MAECDQVLTLVSQPGENLPLTSSCDFDKSEMDSNIPLQPWRGGCCVDLPLNYRSDLDLDSYLEPECLFVDCGPDSSNPPQYQPFLDVMEMERVHDNGWGRQKAHCQGSLPACHAQAPSQEREVGMGFTSTAFTKDVPCQPCQKMNYYISSHVS